MPSTPKEIMRMLLRAQAVKAIAFAKIGNTKVTDFQFSVPCPFCETGKLDMAIVGQRQHCHARCTTEGCINFLE
jgi:hypothetical protein